MGEKIEIVLDTNVLISGFGWNKKPERCFKLVIQDEVRNYTTPEIIEEVRRVLNYPKFEFSDEEKQKFLEIYVAKSHLIETDVDLDVVEDPDDNKFLECAVTADVDYIVSGDPDLTDVNKYDDIEIVSPDKFLEHLES